MHLRAKQYDNETEHLYSFIQVMTACTASFAHGANDVSNAVGPYAVIYHIWSTSKVATSSSPIPVWILVFGAAMLVIGLATCTSIETHYLHPFTIYDLFISFL
jgi:sodium-dependent phosphate transporter